MSKSINLLNEKFGLLTVIGLTDKKDKSGCLIWKCRCDCGNVIELSTSALKRPERKSCGCLMQKRNDLLNKKFGRLAVVEFIRYDSAQHACLYKCKCDCGNYTNVISSNLLNGKTLSCGCYATDCKKSRRKYQCNETATRLYRIWNGIKARCSNPRYKNYFGRGIRICNEWKLSFENFKKWALNNGYADNLSIDRIDNNGNYEPSNCRWADYDTQANNTRRTTYLTIGNETRSASEWSKIVRIKKSTILYRKRAGWSDYDCLYITTK